MGQGTYAPNNPLTLPLTCWQDVQALWTGILALSFAFTTPIAEIVNSCVFVFAKHAYDVGDFVETKGKKMVVRQIYLTHTNFEEVNNPDERGKALQIAHSSLTAEVIVNWTRSLDAAAEAVDESACTGGKKDA